MGGLGGVGMNGGGERVKDEMGDYRRNQHSHFDKGSSRSHWINNSGYL